jgi:hypothetical protein
MSNPKIIIDNYGSKKNLAVTYEINPRCLSVRLDRKKRQ